ncbi:MAG: hypothetical protein JXX14_21075, partial [Deltaproteobacteria bacterium]|nr:hypothetical protein [Deltaproteobacteria bacterium]
EALVMAALSKDANARPQSMKEFGQTLDGMLGIEHSGKTTVASAVTPAHAKTQRQPAAASATVPMPAQSVPSPVVRSGKGSPVLGIVAGVVVLLLGGGAAGWYFLMGPGSAGGQTTVDDANIAANVETVATSADVPNDEDNTPPGMNDVELPPGPDSLAANPGAAEVAADAGPSSGKGGNSRIAKAKQLAASGQVNPSQLNQAQLKNVNLTDEQKKKIQDAAASGKVPEGVKVPENLQVPDDLKQKLAETIGASGGSSGCRIVARGGENASSLSRGLKRKLAALKNCIEDGTDSSAYAFSISSGSKDLSGVSISQSGNSAQANCIKGIISKTKMVSSSDADESGTITFTTEKSGGEVSKCVGVVKL